MIIDRIKQSIPPNLNVTKQSTPIAYFGKYESAKACTISLNPSDREFYNGNGDILLPPNERLCSRTKLDRLDNEELNDSNAKLILEYCDGYFQRNPYRAWFDRYEALLQCFELSYYDASVVHLDLVQWATTPIWRNLANEVKEKLLKTDLPFLKKQLIKKSFEYIFLNGRTTVEQVSEHLNIDLEELNGVFGGGNFTIFFGEYNGARVIGWSPYLQSATVNSYDRIRELAQVIKEQNNQA